MSQKTLTGETVQKKKRNWRTKRFLQYVWEDCPNCGTELKFSIYAEAEDFDAETKRPNWDMGVFTHGEKSCKCGAELLIADDMESVNIYWLNREKMLSLGGKPTQ